MGRNGFSIHAITRDRQKVEYLLVGGAFFRTDKRVGPGSTPSAIQSAYGTPTTQAVPNPGQSRMIYDAIGFAAVVEEGQVYAVIVFWAGTAKSIWKYVFY